MPFPESPRVVYQRNTLKEVICQLRFPTILKVESDPTPFQERVRDQYPLYREADLIAGPPLPPELRNLFLRASGAPPITRQFLSADEQWTLGLNRDFLAVSTTQYERWEGFHSRLSDAVKATQELFAPAFFSRVGLRYRNVIDRTVLNLQGRPWADLLAPHIAAVSASDMAGDVVEASHSIIFRLDLGGAQVRLQHNLEKSESGDVVYVIDADFFTETRTETANVLAVLDNFNGQARRLFRWCITPLLHEHLRPQPIGAQ